MDKVIKIEYKELNKPCFKCKISILQSIENLKFYCLNCGTKYLVDKPVRTKGKKPIKNNNLNKPKRKKKRKKKIPPINYRHGKTYGEFLQSEYWKKTRLKAMKRDNFKCTVCGSAGKLEVHHTTYKHCGLEYLHMNDLLTLCISCHTMAHKYMDIT